MLPYELPRIGFRQEFGWDSFLSVRSVLILIHVNALSVSLGSKLLVEELRYNFGVLD
jgi:hypothetical protein